MVRITRRTQRTGRDKTTVLKWLQECLSHKPGESIFIPCDNAQDRKLLLALFNEELKVMSKIDPIDASAVFVKESYKDSRFWLILERKQPVSKVGYIKSEGEELQRKELDYLTFERRRILDLMLKDELKLDLIEKLVENLTKQEISYIKRKGG